MTEVNLNNLAAKTLADLLTLTGWCENRIADIYVSGQILVDVLPQFEVPPADASEETKKRYATPPPPPPVPPAMTEKGEPDFPRMSRSELEKFAAETTKHQADFIAWARKKLPTISFTDQQLATVQQCLKYYAPLKPSDRDPKSPRQELKPGEFSYLLLKEFKLGITPQPQA